ncbi:Penicillin-insensitive murein endopeptidase precursor [Shewanella sp. P1-14-1]|uniref:penicillin-insensitive murein endopeptidase n=1 Tax=Shewanella sp. P1-14-1 TaxID=1723761 RepID=UPI0006D673ED|nr:penicillin-insensitive murein endopeptidase [Shewanella sp. P1-14-1]KPZ73418.1 Penicillin-insensitive murein endopeptidase precursor [Shewanella sp. P1-14-1]
MRYFSVVIILMLLMASLNVQARFNPWEHTKTPFEGPAAAIGEYANGCLSGAEALPLSGKGFQVIRPQRDRYYGHPNLVNFVQQYAVQLQGEGIEQILVGDMSMPRGGQFDYGHSSHQIGLDVDIWLRLTEKPLSKAELKSPRALTVVDNQEFAIDTAAWNPQHKLMIKVAAQDPQVARIFVNGAIKQQLCNERTQADDAWLNKVRPWWGHSAHMHVRLNCPKDNPDCKAQKPINPGHGCEDIAWWKQQFYTAKSAPKKELDKPSPRKPKPLQVKPQQCEPLTWAAP